MKTSIKFINHASVIISDNNTSVLSDPWYDGDAFHKGWNLLYETKHHDIEEFLSEVTHIWISHEHPDHFSISFFKKFAITLKKNSIKILFQKTKDRRVYNFLIAQGLEVLELDFNRKYNLSENFFITCIKDGFYDSGLFVESYDEKILNLNDCEINTLSQINEVKNICGNVDVLLTQFSFAAWKGGKKNKRWRLKAAEEKLRTIKLQIKHFNPNFVIPFASFIYFSNIENSYLNDAANRPDKIVDELKETSSEIIVMKPNDIFKGIKENTSIINAVKFWNEKFDNIDKKQFHHYDKISLDEIFINFKSYCERIKKKNNLWFIKLVKIICPIPVFEPVIIEISDLNCNIKFDYIKKEIYKTNEEAQLCMKSESLNFIFKNNFGFDTLTVNGCFEEKKKGGFITATKTLAIENLNNLGIYFSPKILFNFSIMKIFLTRLNNVRKKLI